MRLTAISIRLIVSAIRQKVMAIGSPGSMASPSNGFSSGDTYSVGKSQQATGGEKCVGQRTCQHCLNMIPPVPASERLRKSSQRPQVEFIHFTRRGTSHNQMSQLVQQNTEQQNAGCQSVRTESC